METVVEVGDWEHQCCGPAYERNAIVSFSVIERADLPSLAVRHDHEAAPEFLTPVRGRVVNLQIQHSDGTTEEILRVLSGRALRGFDDAEDGHVETPWDQQQVINDSNTFLITLTVSP